MLILLGAGGGDVEKTDSHSTAPAKKHEALLPLTDFVYN